MHVTKHKLLLIGKHANPSLNLVWTVCWKNHSVLFALFLCYYRNQLNTETPRILIVRRLEYFEFVVWPKVKLLRVRFFHDDQTEIAQHKEFFIPHVLYFSFPKQTLFHNIYLLAQEPVHWRQINKVALQCFLVQLKVDVSLLGLKVNFCVLNKLWDGPLFNFCIHEQVDHELNSPEALDEYVKLAHLHLQPKQAVTRRHHQDCADFRKLVLAD